MQTRLRTVLLLAAAVLLCSCSSSATSSSTPTSSVPGVTASTIKIGFITSETGAAASSFANSAIGAEAYIDAVNAAGGIYGRKIQLVVADDMSSTSGALTATQSLISKGVFGIINGSAYFFAAYRAAQQAGVPVTAGSAFDGPEWGEQPNTNMFSASGGVNPNHNQLFAVLPAAALAKYVGATNVGGIAYGSSPASVQSISDLKTVLGDDGIKMGYENLTVQFGTSDTSSSVLAMKKAGVDFAVCSCVQSTLLSLITGLKQSGADAKSLSYSGADSTLFADPTAAAAAQGMYFVSNVPPLDVASPAATMVQNDFKAADPSYKAGEYPTFGETVSYLGAALMVEGLRVAGASLTRQDFISQLSKVTGWDANGLLPYKVSFNHFGTNEPQYCEWFVQVEGQQFVAVDGGRPFCGNTPGALKG